MAQAPDPTPRKRKRPAVVITCTVIFALVSLQGAVALWHGFFDSYILIEIGLLWAGLLCLLFWSRSQITYYVTTAALAALVLKSLDSAVRFRGHVPTLPPDSLLNRFGVYAFVLGICLLFWRFVFARPSRLFYGFIKTA